MPKTAKLPSVWRLLNSSLAVVRANWKILFGVVALVAVPSALVGLVSNLAAGTTVAAYLGLAALLMNTALIWTTAELGAGRAVTLRRAYYDGTGVLVRLMLVGLVLALCTLPLAGGLALIGASLGTAAVQSGERILLGLVALVLALPSLLLISNYVFAIFPAAAGDWPVTALNISRQAVRGRVWAVGGRLLALAAVLIIVLAAPTVVLMWASFTTGAAIWLSLLQLITSLAVLPLLMVYLHQLYRELQR